MTMKELSQLYYLNREIETDRRRLEALRRKASSPSSPGLTGMPYNSTPGNRLERLCGDIDDLTSIIESKLTKCQHERNRLERYISAIPDSLTRQIFTQRFINGKSWGQVAMSVGGTNSNDSVRMICKRYLNKN